MLPPGTVRWVRRLLPFLVVIAGVLQGCSAGGDTVRVAASLGDSFPAGAGAAGMEGPCLRSPKAWPELLAESAGMSMTNLACSGAKIEDFYEQLPELPADVSVVFLQGGGNSSGFREVLGDCLASGCRNYQEITRGRLALVRSEMASFLREVHAVRPGVDEIVFVGYPPSTADGVLCEGISPNLASLLESGTRDLNAVLRAAVEDAALSGVPARFVDVSSLTGHPVCADDPWFHGPERGLLLLHPNDAGHRALADAVAATVLSTTAKVPSG